MSDSISQMTPLLPERADDLQDLALEWSRQAGGGDGSPSSADWELM